MFLHDHGILTMIENAVIGPFAAALWKDGISFGGVVAFIFADLISLPLLFIYRKLYDGRLTLRSAAGIATADLTAPRAASARPDPARVP